MIAVCLKRVDRRPEVDPLTGAVETDDRWAGASEADQAALEWGLRLGEAWGQEVVAVTAGPAGADQLLREAVAAGAARAVRVDLDPALPSEVVAAGLAAAVAGADLVLCGDWSLDRGSGSVPAYLAARLGAAQALGLVTLDAGDGGMVAERRLDGGRRERLRVPRPAVLSVEGGSARLRRAPLSRVVLARTAPVEVVRPALASAVVAEPVRTGPFRPRPRVLPPPDPSLSARERVLALTGALVERTPPKRVILPPDEAADFLLAQLREWGELPEGG